MEPEFDFSSIDLFFEIHNLLQAGKTPVSEQWDTLFETPGYQSLAKGEFQKKFFKDNYTLAFNPDRAETLAKMMKEPEGRYLEHYQRFSSEIESFQTYLEDLKARTTEVSTDVLAQAKEFLPVIEELKPPTISFVLFDHDARSYDSIVFDPLYAMDLGEHLNSVLAHEVHRYFRNQLVEFELSETNVDEILWVMNQIQQEGIADQIDKTPLYLSKRVPPKLREPAQRYQELIENTIPYFEKIDSIFEKATIFPNMRNEFGTILRRFIPLNGHIIGFVMTNTIIGCLGKEIVIETLGNPFEFIRLYNKAVQECNLDEFFFSQSAMSFIDSMEKEYKK